MSLKDLFYLAPPVRSLRDRKVLITGAASGIGRATALASAAQGAQLVVTDLHPEPLDELVAEVGAAGGTVLYHQAGDVSDYDWVARFAKTVDAEVGVMDVVMNIAGISAWGTVENLEHKHWKAMVDVNLMGPIHVIETFVPPMLAAGRGGHLASVSSAAGLVALPWHAAYTASKAGLVGLSEVLRFDLARHRIGVSVVVPGAVKTPLVDSVEISGVDRDHPQVARWVDRFSGHAVTPEHAAAAILAGMAKNRFLIYTSPDIRALYAFKRVAWTPYSVAMKQANVLFARALRPGRRSIDG